MQCAYPITAKRICAEHASFETPEKLGYCDTHFEQVQTNRTWLNLNWENLVKRFKEMP